MSARLAAHLIGEGVLPEAAVRAAAARQLVYGGSLDTALLEAGALGEEALWGRLTAVTGLPAPRPALVEAADGSTAAVLPEAESARIAAVPVARRGETVDVLCAEPVAAAEIRSAVAARGLVARLHVVPEIRLFASRQKVYGVPVPARYVPLLARLRGTGEIRRRQRPAPQPPRPPDEAAPEAADITGPLAIGQTPLERMLDLVGPLTLGPPLEMELDRPDEDAPGAAAAGLTEVPAPGIQESASADLEEEPGAQPMATMPEDLPGSTPELAITSSAGGAEGMEGSSGRYPGAEGGPRDAATEALCRRARDRTDKGRVLALRALRRRHHLAAVRGLLEELRRDLAQGSPEEALGAVVALGELRDTSSIPAFIELLVPASAPLAIAAQQALVALAAQDFGSSQRRWSAWWHRRAGQHRIEWLIDGMGHADTEIRAAAGEELRQISGVSFEFSPELPKASREKAQQWARAWWAETGRARFGGGGGTSGSL